MIPIRDNIRTRRYPWMVLLLIVLNLVAFAYELKLGPAIEEFISRFGLIPWSMTQGLEQFGFSPEVHVLPWFTSMFLHGGWMHLLGNMWFLWLFGGNVEDNLGPLGFLVFYLLGGLAAAGAHVAATPLSLAPTIGASGAVSAVLAGYLVLYPRARIVTLVPLFIFLYFTELPAFLFIGVWFAIQYFQGTAALGTGMDSGVAWWAHIGGFIAGIPMILVLGKRVKDQGSRTRSRPGTITVIKRRS